MHRNSRGAQHSDREAQFAGKFYPGTSIELKKNLFELFRNVGNDTGSDTNFESNNRQVRALISPHAGYIFSGKVAAAAFHQIAENKNFTRVFVLASSHTYAFDGAAVFTDGNYKTPLGEVKVDTQLGQNLVKNSELFVNHSDAHLNEHSLEVQLPFLQFKLDQKFLVVPIILGTRSPEHCKKIAQELKPWFTSENLFVISTDFSHYPSYRDASRLDYLTADAICSNQPEKLLALLNEKKDLKIKNLSTMLCGWTSVLTLLYLTENNPLQYNKVQYLNSGDSKHFGEKDRVVGYWAISILEEEESFRIDDTEKDELLEKARNAIYSFVKSGKRAELEKPRSNGILNEKTGVFVSIYIEGKLRGCIGGFAQEKSLNDLVQNMAVSASCDLRFDSIQPEELENMELEISVLSPLKEIKSKDEISMGKHGIYIRKGFNTGTFLPQVALKTGWNVDELLGHCSRDKAGIGWNGWKKAELFTYEAIVFRGR